MTTAPSQMPTLMPTATLRASVSLVLLAHAPLGLATDGNVLGGWYSSTVHSLPQGLTPADVHATPNAAKAPTVVTASDDFPEPKDSVTAEYKLMYMTLRGLARRRSTARAAATTC